MGITVGRGSCSLNVLTFTMRAVKCEGVKEFASQGKKCKSYKHVSSSEMNFSRNCTLDSIQVAFIIYIRWIMWRW